METVEFKKSVAREYFEAIVLAVVLALFFRTFVVEAFKIPSSSMEDNLLIGDHILVNKFAYAPTMFNWEKKILPIRNVSRTDVIVFKYPEDPGRNFIKRVIAVENEEIEIRNRQVLINSKPIEEPYKVHKSDLQPDLVGIVSDDFGPKKVGKGLYFAMGDNRDNSKDSRAWGLVPKDFIKGRAFIVYWSFDGPQNIGPSTMGENLRHIAHIVVNFIPDTRWERFFKIIR
ncbi:signal peptidase I [bacterium]|nr:signal peptidase I [bacterium]MCI0602202.1 signal peptidase I [bacterium]